jgi:Fe-S-cluster containining protein
VRVAPAARSPFLRRRIGCVVGMPATSLPPLDTTLLGGFQFECRPDCGLCCFSEPALTREESTRLLQIEPELPIEQGRGGWSYLAHRPNGGSCSLLTDLRCRAHAARPSPCAMFPVTVHVSDRAQATVVLSCPGLHPAGLLRWAEGPPRPAPASGLGPEVEAAEREWHRSGSTRELERHRVRYRAGGGSDVLDGARAEWHKELPWPNDDDFPPEAPPDPEDGFENLPITYSASHGRVAFGAHPGGWQLFRLSEAGDAPEPLDVIPPPESVPALTFPARELARGYVHYLLERDDALDAVLAESEPEGPTGAAIVADILRTTATALARASVLQRAEGRDGPLDAADVWNGVRAVDAEWLDRPTVGRRF